MALLTGGCIDTDAAVFVEATISDAEGNVQQSSLASGIGGSFRVLFHLGPRASGPSEVALGGFSLTDAERAETLLPTLEVSTTPGFPLEVPVDGDVAVQVTFAPDDNLLEPTALDGLCAPAGARVVGVFDDALRGGSVSVASEAILFVGCP